MKFIDSISEGCVTKPPPAFDCIVWIFMKIKKKKTFDSLWKYSGNILQVAANSVEEVHSKFNETMNVNVKYLFSVLWPIVLRSVGRKFQPELVDALPVIKWKRKLTLLNCQLFGFELSSGRLNCVSHGSRSKPIGLNKLNNNTSFSIRFENHNSNVFFCCCYFFFAYLIWEWWRESI